MKFRKSLLLFLLMALTSVTAYADAEFYGIQMRDEHVAKSLVLAEEQLTAEEIGRGALFNKSVYATASLKEDTDQRVNFSVNIFNNSDKVISADYQYRDYYLVTKEGRKYPLYDPEAQFDLDEILPKTNVTFQPSLGNLVISKKNIKMIVCSFDLGRTSLVLFPSSKKEVIEKLVPPAVPAPIVPDAKEHKRGLPRLFAPHPKPAKVQAKSIDQVKPKNGAAPINKPIPAQQGDRTLLNGETQQEFAWPKDNPTVNTQSAVEPPTDNRVAAAIKNFVYVPATGVENVVSAVLPQSAPLSKPAATSASKSKAVPKKPEAHVAEKRVPRSEAQVLQYNPDYKFITCNVGVKDGLKKNMLIYILRDGKTIAHARIKQIREAVSAASVIPDSVISEVRAGDKISLA